MKRFPLGAQLVVALVAGGLVGRALGASAAPLGALALIYVKLLKLLATPLVFVAIVDTFCAHAGGVEAGADPDRALHGERAGRLRDRGGGMHLFPLGRFVDGGALARAAAPAAIRRRMPSARSPGSPRHVLDHLLVDNVLWVIGVAVLAGLGVRLLASRVVDARGGAVARLPAARPARVGARGAAGGVRGGREGGGRERLPAVVRCCVFSSLVGAGIALQVFGWYSLVLKLSRGARRGVLSHRRRRAFHRVLGGSSLATLPVTLHTLEIELACRAEAARLAACVGTNLNHDGIMLYEAAAALFVAHAFAIPLGVGAQLKMVAASVLAAVGIAGVPEAGLITLSLVLGAAGLPLAAVPLSLPVDWLLGRLRAAANVASDLVVATLVKCSR